MTNVKDGNESTRDPLSEEDRQDSEKYSETTEVEKQFNSDVNRCSQDMVPATETLASGQDVLFGWPLFWFSIGIMAVVFLMCLDHYILATAIPRITTDFNSIQDAAWYSSGYYLTNMAVQPTFGQLYSLFRVKLTFLACVLLFEAGSVVCALAPSSATLIIGRLITGVGGGGLYVGCVVLIGSVIPGKRRPAYISMVTSLDGVAALVGPLLGGVLTDSHLTWRFCFWVNLPIGFVALAVLWLYLPALRHSSIRQTAAAGSTSPRGRAETAKDVARRLAGVDWLSLVLLLSGFTMLLLALQWAGPKLSWSDGPVVGCLVGGSVLLVVYMAYQHHQGDKAAIPLRILRQRTIFCSAGFMLAVAMLIGNLVYYLPFEFQAVLDTSARQSGIWNLAFLVPLMMTPLISGSLIGWTGHYVPFLYGGSIVATTGAALITTINAQSKLPRLVGYQFLAGFGTGFCHQIPYTSILNMLEPQDLVSGSALCSFVNSLGAILGIVMAQSIFTNRLISEVGKVAGADVNAVLRAGPTNIVAAVPARLVLSVRQAYHTALSGTFLLAVASAGACCIFAFGVEWKRIKA